MYKIYAGALFVMQRVRNMIGGNLTHGMDGSGTTIAVLDSGVVSGHRDLEDRVLCFRDFIGYGSRAYDDNGHGTHVCGILCGSGYLSGGKYRGMAPGAKLVAGKVLDEKGDGSTEEMLAGLEWVLQLREKYEIRILNISVGIGNLEEERKERLLREKIKQVWDSGILVVCAAGNKGPGNGTVSSVGGSARVVTVGCHDGGYFRDDPHRCELYSGWGAWGMQIRKPDIVAPGTESMSCNANYAGLRGRIRNAYVAKSGTSMATPIVSGAAALVFQKYPGMTNEECKRKLQYTATDLGLPWNRQGWGMVNVERLLD